MKQILASFLLFITSSFAIASPIIPTGSWEFVVIQGVWPAVEIQIERSTAGIIVGSFYTEQKTSWWAYYTENTSEEFMLVGIAVDGKTITLCDDETTFCNYIADPANGAGGSFITLTDEELDAIKNGTRLDFIIQTDKEAVRVVRPLTGAKDAISTLVAVINTDQPLEVSINDTWTMFEVIDPLLGRVVLINGATDSGEVTVSYSHTAFTERFITLPNYSGAELFFRPEAGQIAEIADTYWSGIGNSKTAPVDFIDSVCRENAGARCLARGGMTIILTEKDLMFLQAGRTLTILWANEAGNRFKSTVQLGEEIIILNNRIRELKGSTTDKTT